MTGKSGTTGNGSELFDLFVDATDAGSAASGVGLTATPHEEMIALEHDVFRVCCGKTGVKVGCEACSPQTCEIETNPYAGSSKCKIQPRKKHTPSPTAAADPAAAPTRLPEELVFSNGRKPVPILESATKDLMREDLLAWHIQHFNGDEIIYVIYKITAGNSIASGSPGMLLADKFIAVPLKRKATGRP